MGKAADRDKTREWHMTGSVELLDFLGGQLADAETARSVGSFGAIAEFMRDAGEAVAFRNAAGSISAVTARGGLQIKAHDALRPIASESLTTQSWSHRVALCLPEQVCLMSGRTVFTEVGSDREALRAEDRAATLFDLGLGTLQLDACVRIADADVVAALRNWVGRSLFEAGNGAMGTILAANPNRVFVSRIGRVEAYQLIPPPNGKSRGVRTPMFFPGCCGIGARTRRQSLFRPAGFRARISTRRIRRVTPSAIAGPFATIATPRFRNSWSGSAT
jgi:hypothetical protein